MKEENIVPFQAVMVQISSRGKLNNISMIKLHKPYLGVEEITAVTQALSSQDIDSGGEVEKLFEKEIRDYFGVDHSINVPSGTAALELAVASLGMEKGDEVIVPSFTYPSDVTSVLLRGATVKFAEIDPIFFNIDPEDIKSKISSKTRTVIVVHYAGMSCQMDNIMALAKKFKLKIIEDATHAWGAKFKGRLLGTIGDVGCFSMHTTKNITSGEGGVFITKSPKIFEKAVVYSQVGTNRYHFMMGKVDKYQWVSHGSSYYLSGLQAAVARVQLRKLEEINKKRTKVATIYLELLSGIKEVTLPKIPTDCQPNWHIFAILVKNNKRSELIKFLKSKRIETAFHYIPLHSSKMGKRLGYKKNDFKVTNSIASSLLRLPIYPELSYSDIKYIVTMIKRFFKNEYKF